MCHLALRTARCRAREEDERGGDEAHVWQRRQLRAVCAGAHPWRACAHACSARGLPNASHSGRACCTSCSTARATSSSTPRVASPPFWKRTRCASPWKKKATRSVPSLSLSMARASGKPSGMAHPLWHGPLSGTARGQAHAAGLLALTHALLLGYSRPALIHAYSDPTPAPAPALMREAPSARPRTPPLSSPLSAPPHLRPHPRPNLRPHLRPHLRLQPYAFCPSRAACSPSNPSTSCARTATT